VGGGMVGGLDGCLVCWGWRVGAVLGVEVVLIGGRAVAAICMAALGKWRAAALVEMGLAGVLEDWKWRADF
jgi:hypothetical protein